MTERPDQEWWTPADIAAAALPDMPSTKRGVALLATRLNWTGQASFARRRSGRGGGWEYHWLLFPTRAQSWLISQAGTAQPSAEPNGREEAWQAFDGLHEKAKAEARSRLATIHNVEALERGGLCRDQAVRDVARMVEKSPRTLWNWLAAVEGIRTDDRLPYLAPRHGLAKRKSRAAGVDHEFGALIKSDYLRPEQPTMASVYDRCVRLARNKGIDVPKKHTVYRWFKRDVSEATIVLMRKGLDALKAMYPPQVRDKSMMHAMEGVNGDFHRFDVFVRFPASGGLPEEIIRPQMVAFQDIYSGRLLSWRVDRTANSHAVQLCIGDMIERWGVPEQVLLDNGREFAAKLITGGSETRYRFKAKDDDVPGLLTSLGCEIHWAMPYSGQSKPIERAFRDLADRVSKHPRFTGAYTGNAPDAKPENYGNAAIPLEDFLKVLAEELELHNMRPDRRSEVAFERSFVDVFDESYAVAPIRKATEEQRRLWLMGAEGLRVHSKTGEIKFLGNQYFSQWLHSHLGERLVGRFDRAALWDGLHMYALSGEYLGHAECMAKAGFFDAEEARAHSKARGNWMRAEKEAAKAHKVYTAAQLGEALAQIAPDAPAPDMVEAKVVRMVQNKRPAPPVDSPEDQAAHQAFVANFNEHRAAISKTEDDDDPRARFARALELESQIDGDAPLTRDQSKWLSSYQSTPEYRTWTDLYGEHGTEILSR